MRNGGRVSLSATNNTSFRGKCQASSRVDPYQQDYSMQGLLMSRTISPTSISAVSPVINTGPPILGVWLVQPAPGLPFMMQDAAPVTGQLFIELVEFSNEPDVFVSVHSEA